MTTPQPTPERPRLIAHEEASRRFILGIGSQRIAFDCSVRATNLPPHTGDKPAPVLRFRKIRNRRPILPPADSLLFLPFAGHALSKAPARCIGLLCLNHLGDIGHGRRFCFLPLVL